MIKTNEQLQRAIEKVIEYNWADEEADFKEQRREGNSTQGHIFTVLRDLDKWLSN